MITAKLVPKRSILTSALYVLIILLACDTTYTMEPPQKPLPHDVVKKLQSFFNKPIGQAFGLHGYNDLMFALIVGNEQEARRIIERDPAQIRGRTNIGLTPLHFAAVFSSVALIEYLIDHGGDVLINDDISVDDESSHVDWDSPLDCAITRRNPEPALYLISRGANVDQECLLRAIARGNIATVYHLLHHGVVWDDDADFDSSLEKISDVQLRNEMKRLLSMFGVACISEVSIVDPLQRAARCGQSAEVEKLLSGAWYIPQFIHNYFMYPPDQLGRALAYSVCRHPHISRLLLHAGAKLHDVEPVVEAYNQRQITKRKDHAEFESQNRGSQVSEIQDLIREQKRALKAQDLELYRATQHVIQTRDNELFSSLSECQKRGPATCFHRLPPHILRTVLAYKNGRLWGAQHNNPERITAQQELVTAIKESDLQSVRLLLSQGANPNARCQLTHEPLLHVAFCADNYSELIELLLDHGAYPNPELNNGMRFFDLLVSRCSLQPLPGMITSISLLLSHWDKMDHVIQSDYALAFGLQLWFGFLVGPEELAEHGKSLLNKIDAFRTHIKDPMDRVHYDQHLSNQVLQFYDYFIKKVIYEEAWASWTEVDTFLDYECVMDLLLQRWPHVGVQIVHLLSYGNQRADIIANFLKTIGDTPEIIQQVEQLYRCLLQPSQISDYETLFFSYRDIISVLMARWPHRELALKLESHYKILGQKLVLAAQQGAINQVKKWLQEGADPSKCKVEGSSLMEFLVLHQPYKNSTERVNIIKIITLLLSHGADGNPTRGEGTTGLLIRLVNDPLYRHFVAARTPILLRLLDELKRRQGQENVVLRMRLQGALMGSAKPSSSLMS